jgi:hypothetical protein
MTLWGVIASGHRRRDVRQLLLVPARPRDRDQALPPFIEKHGRWLTLDWYDVEKAERCSAASAA